MCVYVCVCRMCVCVRVCGMCVYAYVYIYIICIIYIYTYLLTHVDLHISAYIFHTNINMVQYSYTHHKCVNNWGASSVTMGRASFGPMKNPSYCLNPIKP